MGSRSAGCVSVVTFTALESVQLGVLAMIVMAVPKAMRDRKQRVVLHGLRGRHFLGGLKSIGVTVVSAGLLLSLDSPLRWGWWSMMGGHGNVVFAQTQPSAAGGLSLSVCLGAACVVLLLVMLPRLALAEERHFRRGDQARSLPQRLLGSTRFGMMHLIMGIPIGAGFALSVAGVMFSRASRRGYRVTGTKVGALLESARVHLAYDLIVLAIVGMTVFTKLVSEMV